MLGPKHGKWLEAKGALSDFRKQNEILVTKGTAEKSVCQLQAAREQVNIWVWGKGKVRSTMLDMK